MTPDIQVDEEYWVTELLRKSQYSEMLKFHVYYFYRNPLRKTGPCNLGNGKIMKTLISWSELNPKSCLEFRLLDNLQYIGRYEYESYDIIWWHYSSRVVLWMLYIGTYWTSLLRLSKFIFFHNFEVNFLSIGIFYELLENRLNLSLKIC